MTLNGNLTSLGSATSVTVYFNYATDAYYTANNNTYNNTTSTQTMTASGSFTFNITDLTPGTEYHFQAVTNGGTNITRYGSDMTYSTAISTTSATSTTTTQSISNTIIGTGTVDVSNDVTSSGEFVAPVTLSSQDNNATINIAAGISGTTSNGTPLSSVTITQLLTLPAPPPSGEQIILTPYEIGPSGTKFSSPIDITFNYDPAKLASGFPATSLVIAYYSVSEGKWINLGGTINSINHTITVQVNHFTAFAVFQVITATTSVSGHKSSNVTWVIISVVVVIMLIILVIYFFMKNRIPKAKAPVKKETNEYNQYVYLYNTGLDFYNRSDYQKSINYFTQCIDTKPSLVYAFCVRGSAFYALGQLEKVMEDFNKAILVDPGNDRAYYGRAITYLTGGNEINASYDFNQVIRLSKDHELTDIAKHQLQEINDKH